jgi:tetratricopeptide (TPR) repeat protein
MNRGHKKEGGKEMKESDKKIRKNKTAALKHMSMAEVFCKMHGLLEQGKSEDANAYYKSCATWAGSRYIDMTIRWAIMLESAGHADQAMFVLGELLRDCHDPRLLNSLGIIRKNAGQHDSARQAFESAILLDPEQSLYWANLGMAAIECDQKERAFFCFRRCFAIDSDQDWCATAMAVLADEIKIPHAAIQEINRALARKPESYHFQRALAMLFVSLEKYDRALECLNTAICINPSDLDLNFNRARVLDKLGRRNESIAAMELLVENFPWWVQGKCYLAELYTEKGMLIEAEWLLIEVLKNEPDSYEANDLIAQCYYLLEQYENAAQHALRACRKNPNQTILGNLEMLFGKMNDSAGLELVKKIRNEVKNG